MMQEQVDHFRLLEIIERGKLIDIYRAQDTQSDRPVILKLVHPELTQDPAIVDQFRKTAEQLLGLHLPHTVSVRAACTSGKTLYVATEMPRGESLKERLAQSSPMDVDDVLAIIASVAEALDYAHKQGLVHYDVRPANIYIDGKTVKLANFCVLEAAGAPPDYQAPEQLDDEATAVADHRSDIYALGCVAYHMLTAKPPFEGSPEKVAAAHKTQRPTPPRVHNPELLPALDAILFKALAKKPEGRYQSAGELSGALQKALQVAQTRQMAGSGMFASLFGPSDKTTRPVSILGEKTGIPVWIWVASGILIAVITAIAILLATG